MDVGQRVQAGGRLRDRVGGRQPEEVLRERHLTGGCHFEGSLTEPRRPLAGLLGPAKHVLRAVAEALASRQLERQQDGRQRAAVLLCAMGRRQAGLRVTMAPEHVLDAGAGRDDRHAAGMLGAHELEDIAQRAAAAVQPAVAGLRVRQRHQQPDPLLFGGGALGQQPQRGLIPARGERGGAARARSGRLHEHRDRAAVALLGRSLDVRGLRLSGCLLGREHRRDPPVGTGSPAAGGELVDGRADDWVAKGELPADGGRVDELGLEQLIGEIQRLARTEAGRAGRQRPLEGVAGDGRALQQQQPRRRQGRQLVCE